MKESTLFFKVVYLAAKPFFQLFFPFRAHGLENVPTDTPVVLCGNHPGSLDPILIRLALPRGVSVRIMAKKELMDTPLRGWFLRRIGVFGVDRGHSDLAAVKTSIQSVREGSHLLVFPEGTRVKYEGEVRPKGGVVMIAMRTGAPLLPVYIGGGRRLFHVTHLVFGEPFEAKAESRRGTAEEYQAYADEVMRRAYALGREWKKR